mmetsp:Transcript_13808/g.20215  ORF Transcript_13808/g.20215 Transcript_13808/m.20215 type:complete len:159 (+) Transcript_13808:58-534(+)|eukprot:CAMPEP_0197242184 /NCGR_PEP_ID=MMETSP1429-20130617/8013_1 /TAXON_ID=49237 /ORGANISM="Chaetoceros  sp., Strain UNC1202" /LENGTH=158 /DNA_ID=CAMNT_0042702163 /DNA_START=43 /DNA_END=519 /DNA_ORIENTATION=+
MKSTVIVAAACIASASAFAPSTNGARQVTSLNEKKSFFKTVFEMDLFAPNAEQNDYGARNKKNLSTGKLNSSSYIPNGLTKAEYEKIRAKENKTKADNYAMNVAKAGKFLDYTEFYINRGTDKEETWKKDINLGHRMAKTKFDWSGGKEESKGWFTKK